MPANRFGIDMAEVYRTTEAVKGARTQNKLASLQLSEAERKIAERPAKELAAKERKNKLTSLRGKVVAGDVSAQQQLLAIDPEGGAKFMDAVGKMDDRQLEATKKSVDEMGQLSAYVMQGKTPEEQARRYSVMYKGISPDTQSKLPDSFDPDFMEMSLTKATAMDKILENPKSVKVGGQDILYKGGRELERADIPEKGGSGGGLGGMKSADENTMYKQAAELMGGMFDAAGNLQMMDPEVRPKVQQIATRATEIFREGKVTRSRAVAMAKKELDDSEAAPAESSSQYNEGQRAKNSAGEIIVFKNGEWIKE